MKVLCNTENCRWNIEDEDENNLYHRKCSLKEIEIWLDDEDTKAKPVCFTYEKA